MKGLWSVGQSLAFLALCTASTLAQHEYIGALRCQQCHFEPGFRRQQVRGFLQLREARIWKHDDKHSMAVRLLFGVSRGEEGRLVIAPSEPDSAVGLNMLLALKVL